MNLNLFFLLASIFSLFSCVSEGHFRKGMNLVDDETSPYGSTQSIIALKELKAVGVDWVTFTPVAMMDNYQSNYVNFHKKQHANRKNYLSMIRYAHSLGMKVSFKPLLFLSHPKGEWHGTIMPGDINRWYDSFSNYLRYYLKIAQEGEVEEFTVGSELISMMTGYPDKNTFGYVWKWIDIIQMARKIYDGELTYDFNFGVEFPTFYKRVMEGNELFIRLYKELNSLGYDSYQNLGKKEDKVPSEELVSYLVPFAKIQSDELALMMKNMKDKTGVERKLIIKEVGFKSTPQSYIDPWIYDDPSLPVDLKTQESAYEAYLKVFMNNPFIGGIFWWDYPTNPLRGGVKDNGYTPRNKPTMEVIKRFWNN